MHARKDAELASCYRRVLEVAHEHGLTRLAFPSISTGAYRFPLDRAARIAARTLRQEAARISGFAERRIVLVDDATLAVHERALAEHGAGEV